MNKAPEVEAQAQLTKFERFLIAHQGKLMWSSFIIAFVLMAMFAGGGGPMEKAPENAKMQTARSINLCLFSYSNDHNQKYPVGKSSTEIFQQLIDQQYVSDPTIFYFPMEGKIKPTGSKLKPENVCWDVTNNILGDDSDELPVVFETGFKIDYVPGGKVHPLKNADPTGIAVAYKSNSAMFISNIKDTLFIPSTFDPKGRTYQQLTPDGPLP